MTDTELCPCTSGRPFAGCCGPILAGTAKAATAEALMRSRYAAFVRFDMAYLGASLVAAKRPGFRLDYRRLERRCGLERPGDRKAALGGPDGWRGEPLWPPYGAARPALSASTPGSAKRGPLALPRRQAGSGRTPSRPQTPRPAATTPAPAVPG